MRLATVLVCAVVGAVVSFWIFERIGASAYLEGCKDTGTHAYQCNALLRAKLK